MGVEEEEYIEYKDPMHIGLLLTGPLCPLIL
jgi:hypothetical protein